MALMVACGGGTEVTESTEDGYSGATKTSALNYPEETHFKSLRQLTWGGDNAEAYWSFDDKQLVFQATNPDWAADCDRIYVMGLEGLMDTADIPSLVSTGWGRTTCSYFLPGNDKVLYASTHLADSACPAVPERRPGGKYVWPIYESFDIFISDLEGTILQRLTDTPCYDAEATVSPKGDKIVFTSMRSGDLELYLMNIDGTDVQQITNTPGYDGGAFFSPDGSKLVWRASRPSAGVELDEYKALLLKGLVEPTNMEVFVADADGSNAKQITQLGKANWCPFFHPSGQKIIFASNHQTERGFPFNLYMVNLDGTGLERITHDGTFDAFPVFSNDGKYLVFSSNRNNGGTRETNLFLAEWQD
jgi:dipeptidyl aminopeptidase/acylaminoacyl peptidase